ALAVISVILFHADLQIFNGGFVGVDIFFVISGYLITTIIVNDLENENFSLTKFYKRRALRLLPALYFVLLVCIPFAFFWMIPGQLKDFSQSLASVNLFISNVLFWKEAGYFSAISEEKPLLHTWSLAVEEQYYLIFPIFLVTLWHYGLKKIFWVILLLCLTSFMASEFAWRISPDANFYLAPTRVWEIFSGSIVAICLYQRKIIGSDLYSFLGCLAILISIFFYNKQTPFPSAYTLLPVLGTILIILYADKSTLVGKLLSLNFFVGIGLISYSAYLWHQPLFAFARIRLYELNNNIMLLLVFATFLIGYLSWRFIEKPFRTLKNLNNNMIFISFALIALVFVVISFLLLSNNMNREMINGNNFSKYKYTDESYEKIGFPNCEGFNLTPSCGHDDTTNTIAWGDSYVKHSIPFVKSFKGINIGQLALSACPPFVESYEKPNIKRTKENILLCSSFNQKVLNYIKGNSSIKKIILGSRFTLIEDMKVHQIEKLAEYFYIDLKKWLKLINRPIDVIILPPPPTPNYDPSRCINHKLMTGYNPADCDFKESDFGELYLKQKIFIDKLSNLGLDSYPLESAICQDGFCKTIINKIRVFRDDGHLRNESSEYFGKIMGEYYN
ncbi:acyltransferase family protein, partial [Methylophilaceae bacterium]|nr:acyltransferase family protein [Methylophilaceae bacterium]